MQPLIDLQDVDGRVRDLEREIKDIPLRKAQENARLAGVNATLSAAQIQLKDVQLRIKQSEADVEDRKEKIRQMKISQGNLKTNKEFQAFNLQIEGIQKEIDEIEARQLAMMDTLPPIQKRGEEAQAKVNTDKGGVDSFCQELDARLAEVKAELETVMVERKAAAVKVPPKFSLYYEHLRTKRWPVVVRLNEDGVCDGCHLVQPPSVAQMVDHNAGLVACTMCGRILYRD